MTLLATVFAIAFDPYWVVPLGGGVGFVVAVLLGRRLFAPQRPVVEDDVPLKSFLDGVTNDRRAMPRRRGNVIEVLLKQEEESEPIRGAVLDRSQGGIRVLVDQPFEEGKTWKIRPTLANQTTPWTTITVRSCKRDGTQYELGCQFDGLPNFNLLMQFG